MQPHIILINGLPGTGKTTFARWLQKETGYPLLMRDEMKELLFDILGYSDRGWSEKLGGACYELLFLIMDQMMHAGSNIIVEGYFTAHRHGERIQHLLTTHGYGMKEVLFFCDGEECYRRFEERAEKGIRHPGHVDFPVPETTRELLMQGKAAPVGRGDELIEVDTTEFHEDLYSKILQQLSV